VRLLIGLVLLVAACGPLAPSPLGEVETSPPPPSPELRLRANRLDVHYRLNVPAAVSTRIVAADGRQWVIHADEPRPTPGQYVLQFDGTVTGPGPNERQVLPDGEYQILLEVSANGQRQAKQVPLVVRDADATPPEITELALLPDRITPNFDARDDITHISFRVAKDARVSAFVDAVSATGAVRRVWMGEENTVQAGEQSLTWNGISNGQPLPSGDYLFGVRARDQGGNVVERSVPLVIDDSGVPGASLVSVQIGPLQVIRGDEICLEAIVRNTGQTVLRTIGPDPGYVYNSFDTYSSIEDHRFAERAGYWRVGLNWSGSAETVGATYPYRWGFGRDLRPGDEATVHGCVKVVNEQDKLVYFASLVQENVAIHSSGAGLVRITIT
jgi:hypothetical protein